MSIAMCSENFRLGTSDFSIELTADNNGLTACRLLPRVPAAMVAPGNFHLQRAVKILRQYFDGENSDFDVSLAPDGTPFQKRVWTEAMTIPLGEVRSYSWLAERTGNPRGFRAVANALGANPLLLFVPCHRVVKSDGTLGGFSCGIEWKELLLSHEAARPELVDNHASASVG